MTGGSLQAGPLMDDRALAASDVLAAAPDLILRRRCGPSSKGGVDVASGSARWGPSSTSSSSACWAASRLRRPVSTERTSSSSAVHPASHASTVMRSSRDWRRRAPGVSRCESHCSMTGMPPTS